MATAITFEKFKNRTLQVEGTMAWLSALKNKFLASLCIKLILYIMKKIEKETDLQNLDREISEKIFPYLKNLHDKYQEELPSILNLEFPLITKKNKANLIHYFEFIEDIMEALEIGLNRELASKIEAAAKGINPPAEIPPWREVIEKEC